jgi:hypothetical protein
MNEVRCAITSVASLLIPQWQFGEAKEKGLRAVLDTQVIIHGAQVVIKTACESSHGKIHAVFPLSIM